MNKILTICLLALLCLQSSLVSQTPDQRLDQRRMQRDLEDGHILAWARHKTGVNQDDEFESVAVIPGSDGEDEVWVVVNRTIDGTDYRYIEQFQPVDFGDQNDAWFVDAATGGTATGVTVPEVLGDYPTLRATTDQADLGLTETTLVSNLTDLQDMSNDLAGNYYMNADIDASASPFTPIGTSGSPFTGTFDGNGYTINGLNMDRTGSQNNGLFGQIDGPAQIANVTLASVSITGENDTGALVGETKPSAGNNIMIQNCHSSGTIFKSVGGLDNNYGGLIGGCSPNTATGTTFVYDCSSSCTIDGTPGTQSRDMGGLIGSSRRATISNCFATGDVTESQNVGVPGGDRHGGLIGQAGITTVVTFCYATGNVTCKLEAGGLIGQVADGATVSKCYATGDVTGTDQELGGLIGDNSGDIEDCYAWGDVSGTGGSSLDVGGFVGVGTEATDTYKHCYSIGAATGDSVVGGFAGSGAGVGTDIYWDTEASGNATSDGDLEEEGKTTTWLKTNPNYPSSWDFDTIWFQEYTAPISIDSNSFSGLKHLTGESVCVYADGRPLSTTYLVDANGVIDIGASYNNVIAGINYYSVYKSFPLIEQKTGIRKLAIDFHETLGCNVGVSQAQSSDLEFSTDDFATRIDMVTGFKLPLFMHGWTAEPVVYLWEWDPIPTTVRGMYVDMEITR